MKETAETAWAQAAQQNAAQQNAAFLVRCRYENHQWRFFLENVATRERRGFATFEALCVFVETVLRDQVG